MDKRIFATRRLVTAGAYDTLMPSEIDTVVDRLIDDVTDPHKSLADEIAYQIAQIEQAERTSGESQERADRLIERPTRPSDPDDFVEHYERWDGLA